MTTRFSAFGIRHSPFAIRHSSSALGIRHSPLTLIAWWVTCLIRSSVWLFIKLGLRDLPPVGFSAIRLVAAIAVFLPILVIRRVPLPGQAASGTSSASPDCCSSA